MGWGSDIATSWGVGCRHSLDLAFLWLWCRPVATAPIRPLAWEPPYASGAALEKAKRQKKKKKRKKRMDKLRGPTVQHRELVGTPGIDHDGR